MQLVWKPMTSVLFFTENFSSACFSVFSLKQQKYIYVGPFLGKIFPLDFQQGKYFYLQLIQFCWHMLDIQYEKKKCSQSNCRECKQNVRFQTWVCTFKITISSCSVYASDLLFFFFLLKSPSNALFRMNFRRFVMVTLALTSAVRKKVWRESENWQWKKTEDHTHIASFNRRTEVGCSLLRLKRCESGTTRIFTHKSGIAYAEIKKFVFPHYPLMATLAWQGVIKHVPKHKWK